MVKSKIIENNSTIVKKWLKEITELLSNNFCLEDNALILHKPEDYYNLGFPPEFVDQFIKDHESGDQITNTIYVKGERREIAPASVYNLDFLYGIIELLDIQYTNIGPGGRGSQAREIVELIKQKLDKNTE